MQISTRPRSVAVRIYVGSKSVGMMEWKGPSSDRVSDVGTPDFLIWPEALASVDDRDRISRRLHVEYRPFRG